VKPTNEIRYTDEDAHWVDKYWKDLPGYPVSEWKNAVLSDKTRLGYHEWVATQRMCGK